MWFATGTSPGPLGSGHVLTAPHQSFRTRDGGIVIGAANQTNRERICDVLGNPDWKRDPRFAEGSGRMANLPALFEAMETALGTRDSADWLAAFGSAGVPAGPVQSIGEARSHPQPLARGMVVDLDGIGRPTGTLGRSAGLGVRRSGPSGRSTRPT